MYFKCNPEAGDTCPGEKLRDVYNANESLILSGHAYISPSSFHKYLRCPAAPAREWLVQKRNDFMGDYANFYLKNDSDQATRVLVESMREAESEAVQDGTRLHELLSDILGTDDYDFLFTDKDHDNLDTKEQLLRNYGLSQDFIDDADLVRKFFELADWLRGNFDNADWACSEVWVPLRGFNTWGTADMVTGWNRVLEIYDLKTGRQEVKAEFNEQLLGYAVGVLNVVGWENFDTVELHIAGLRWKGSTWSRSVEQIKNWRDTVLAPKMKECYSFHPQAKPGDHCLYCKAKLFCKEWTDIMLFRHSGGSFDDTGLEGMDSTTLVDRFMWAKQIERFQNAAKDEIALRFEGIDAIQDDRVQYVKPSPVKKFLDEDRVVNYIKDNLEGEGNIKEVPNITPERFEELFGDDAGEFVETRGRRPYIKMA